MHKNLHRIHYHRLFSLYRKLKNRFDKSLKENRFKNYTERKQREIISRLEKLKSRLASLEQVLKLSGSALALGLMLGCGEAQAQTPVASGSEFLVNTYTTSSQNFSSIAMDGTGDFIMVWQSSGAHDGDYEGIYAQRYNAAGVAQGSEFQVNTYTTGSQRYPSVAMDSDGDFVVTWQSAIQDGSGYGIYAQRYNALGVQQGSEFQVNTYTTSYQSFPSVAMDSQGDFVVSWMSNGQNGNWDIYAQRYNAAGVALGSEFQVNSYTTSHQTNPSIAMDSNGDFVVTWMSPDQDGSNYGIYAQRYNASGAAQGGEFRINTFTTSGQRFPVIAMESDGDFVVTWESYGQDVGGSAGIYAQRYNAAGVAQGGEIKVNTYTTNNQIHPSIATNNDGDFVVTWQSDGQDGNNNGVYAQRYNPSGIAVGNEFLVNSYTTSDQKDPSIAMDNNGNIVVTWVSNGQDGSSYGIYAQRYITPNLTPTDISLIPSSVDENVAANTTIGTFSTADPDAGNTFTYTLVTGTGDTDNASFNISGNSLIMTNSPDFETKSSFSIRVSSADQGSLSFEKVFTITIDDVNEAPVISTQTFSVDENSANGTSVGTVAASDADAGQTLSYAITGGNTGNVFAIDNSTGEITVAGTLDYETTSSYLLTISATDNGASALSSSATITININDVNETPVITAQTFSVDENSVNGTSVGTVAASDVDAGQTLSYAITAGNTGNVFSIDNTTGEITVTGALDYETISSYSLTVSVTDNGTSPISSSATVTVNINDVVENPTGIGNAAANKQIGIFPNPSEGQFTIHTGTLSLEKYTMRVVNIMGETVYTCSFSEHLNLQQLSKGVYTLMLESEKEVMVKQIMIQ